MELSPPVRRISQSTRRLNDIPPQAGQRFEGLDPSVRYLWMMGRLIFLMFVGFLGALALVILGAFPWLLGHPLLGAVLVLCCGILVLVYLFWPFAAFKYWGFCFRKTDLLIRSGVFWKHVIAVPFNRIQHVDSSAGPLMRSLGLSRLTIHTAGSQMGSVSLPGLPAKRAEELRNFLSQVGHSHANI